MFSSTQHEYIRNAKPVTILQQIIAEAREIQENETYRRDRTNNVDFVGIFKYLCVFRAHNYILLVLMLHI